MYKQEHEGEEQGRLPQKPAGVPPPSVLGSFQEGFSASLRGGGCPGKCPGGNAFQRERGSVHWLEVAGWERPGEDQPVQSGSQQLGEGHTCLGRLPGEASGAGRAGAGVGEL